MHRVDTRKLKAFIRSRGRLGKSDAIDARELAAYGLERWASLPLWSAPDPCQERLKALVRRRHSRWACRLKRSYERMNFGDLISVPSFRRRQHSGNDIKISRQPFSRKVFKNSPFTAAIAVD